VEVVGRQPEKILQNKKGKYQNTENPTLYTWLETKKEIPK